MSTCPTRILFFADAASVHTRRWVQAVADRRDLEHQLVQLGAEIERLDGALNEVTALIEQGSALKAETMRLEIADADMEALRKRERELANLQLQQQLF